MTEGPQDPLLTELHVIRVALAAVRTSVGEINGRLARLESHSAAIVQELESRRNARDS